MFLIVEIYNMIYNKKDRAETEKEENTDETVRATS